MFVVRLRRPLECPPYGSVWARGAYTISGYGAAPGQTFTSPEAACINGFNTWNAGGGFISTQALQRLQSLTRWIGPLMIVGLGGMIGLIMASLLSGVASLGDATF